MAKIYETLRKKNDPTIEVYPNIESQNIPSGAVTETKIGTNAVTTGKLANSAVNSNKLADGAIISTKLADGAVTTNKIADNSISNAKMQFDSVGTSNIVNYAVTTDKLAPSSVSDGQLSNSLWKWLKRVQNTYLIKVGSSEENAFGIFNTFTADEYFIEFTSSQINNALLFDRASSSDYTTTDLEVYKMIIDGLYKDNYGSDWNSIQISDRTFVLTKSTNIYSIKMIQESTNTTLFELTFDSDTYTITNYIYNKYIYIGLVKLFNQNANYER